MGRDSAGVSPVIATILLIAITVVAVGVVMAFVAGLPTPTPPLIASITIENAIRGNTSITIYHTSGDPVRNAFRGTAGVIAGDNWINLEIRVNGAKVTTTNATLNTVQVTTTNDFVAGDRLVLTFTTPLNSNDVITVIYRPTNQTISTVTVT